MKKSEVYKITNKENGKIYVGITNQGVDVRWSKHCSDARHRPIFPIHNAIRKYGENSFQIELIHLLSDDCDYEDLKNYERYWIAYYDSYNRKKGYNLTLGGDGTFGRFHSKETKDKIRQKALGREVSEEAKQRMSESHKRREYDHDEMSRRATKGNEIRWSDLKAKINASINNYGNRSILKCSLTGEILEEFRSVSEAARIINKSRQSLSKCVTGKAKTAYGFIWKYKE